MTATEKDRDPKYKALTWSYFLIRYTDNLPEKFAGETYGPLIKIRPKYQGDPGIIEHEKVHVRQWYAATAICLLIGGLLGVLVSDNLLWLMGVGPAVHPLLYRWARPYRRWSEVQAYGKQIAVGGSAGPEFAVAALVEKYDLRLSAAKARALLGV